MTNPRVRALADALALQNRTAVKNTIVYLGVLRSNDLKTLTATRRSAVKQFWSEYFPAHGAKSVTYATDGSGQLESFISRAG